MPLIRSGSKKAVSENIRREMHAGKPQKQAIAIAMNVSRRYKKKAGGGEVMSDADEDLPIAGKDYASSITRVLRGLKNSAADRALADKIRHGIEQEKLRLYHGGRDWNAERLVRMPDGNMQFLVGTPGVLPELPHGAEVLRDFPHGRPRSSENVLQGEGTSGFGHGFYGAEARPVGEHYRNLLIKRGEPGKLYELDVGAHPEWFLDWDTPMRNQSPRVREGARQIMRYDPGSTGEDWYGQLARKMGENHLSLSGEPPSMSTSESLRDAGIPGLRFLDKRSRPQGFGTRNYVVMDDDLLDVKGKFRRGGRVSKAMTVASKYAKKAGGGATDVDEFYATPGDPATGAPTRLVSKSIARTDPSATGSGGGWDMFDNAPNDALMGSVALQDRYRPMPWGSDPWVNRLGPTREMTEQREEEERSKKALAGYNEQEALNADETTAYRGTPRLDPGLKRDPGDVESMPIAKMIGKMGGDILTDPISYTPFRLMKPAALSGISFGSEEAEAGMGSAFGKAASGIAKKANKIVPSFEHSTITPHTLADMSAAVETHFDDSKAGVALKKSLTSVFPKGLAIEAIKNDLQADELANLTSYLSPGSKKSFWKWHEKLSMEKPPASSPPPALTVQQALSPENAKAQGWDKAPATPPGGPTVQSITALATKAAKEGWPVSKIDKATENFSKDASELFDLIHEQALDDVGSVKPQSFSETPRQPMATENNPYTAKVPWPSEDASAFFGSNFGPMIESPKASKWKKVGEGEGSNPAGIYQAPDGKKFYIKEAYSPNHVKNELIAASMYDLAGVKTVKMYPVAGKGHIASEMEPLDIPKGKDAIHGMSAERKRELQKDFIPHAWLANWDFPGDGGNFGFAKGGKSKVIDLGATMEYRAMGEPKPNFGPEVTELDSMRDPGKNHLAYSVFFNTSINDLIDGAQRVADIPNDKIRQMVKGHGGLDDLAEVLIDRKIYLANRFDVKTYEDKLLKSQDEMFKQKPFKESDYDFNLKNEPENLENDPSFPPVYNKTDDAEMIGEKDFSQGDISEPIKPGKDHVPKLGTQNWKKWSVYPYDAKPEDARWLQKQTEENRLKGGYDTFSWRGVSTGGHSLDESMHHGQGWDGKLWSTPNIDLASDYSIRQDNVGQRYFRPYVNDPYLNEGDNAARRAKYEQHRKYSRLVPLWINTKEYMPFNAEGRNFTQVYGDIKEELYDIYNKTGDKPPGVIINNVMDTPGLVAMYDAKGLKTSTTTILTLEHGKHTVRSPGAEFNPKKFHLPDWFASAVGFIGGGGAMVALWDPRQAQAKQPVQKARGGRLEAALRTAKHYAAGGALKTEGLGNLKNHLPFDGGMLDSSVPGRTDRLPIRLRSGSYVIPADIPSASALGEGNTMAGKKVLDRVLSPHKERGRSMRVGLGKPNRHSLFRTGQMRAAGGPVDGEIPVVAAGGEYVVDPETVSSLGNGNIDKGHNELDRFVKKVRRDNIKTLRKLAPPKVN